MAEKFPGKEGKSVGNDIARIKVHRKPEKSQQLMVAGNVVGKGEMDRRKRRNGSSKSETRLLE